MNRIIILALLFQISLAAVSHDNEQVWRIFANYEKKPFVNDLVEHFDMDVWSIQSTHMDILITPKVAPIMRMELQKQDISYEIMIENIQEIIDSQEEIRNTRKTAESQDRLIDRTIYHTTQEIYDYMDALANQFDFISVETLGQSIEGRDIKLIKFSTGLNRKNAMWVQCGIHAREWISPATCVYGLYYLEGHLIADANVTSLLEENDLYIVPVVNPDGYEYTWEQDRLWRKNRHVHADSDCFGVDLNRNYGKNFGGVGSSDRPCSEGYHGMDAFSEPEISILRNKALLIQETQNLRTYYDLHSFGQLWLVPYGYTTVPPSNIDNMIIAGLEGITMLENEFGTEYELGSLSTLLYRASGCSIDWAHSIGIEYCYSPELRDKGTYGFLLPEDQISETGYEFWKALLSAYQVQRLL